MSFFLLSFAVQWFFSMPFNFYLSALVRCAPHGLIFGSVPHSYPAGRFWPDFFPRITSPASIRFMIHFAKRTILARNEAFVVLFSSLLGHSLGPLSTFIVFPKLSVVFMHYRLFQGPFISFLLKPFPPVHPFRSEFSEVWQVPCFSPRRLRHYLHL